MELQRKRKEPVSDSCEHENSWKQNETIDPPNWSNLFSPAHVDPSTSGHQHQWTPAQRSGLLGTFPLLTCDQRAAPWSPEAPPAKPPKTGKQQFEEKRKKLGRGQETQQVYVVKKIFFYI